MFFGGNCLKPLAIRRDIGSWVLRISLDRDSILQAVRLEAGAIVAFVRFAFAWMLSPFILLIRLESVFAQPLYLPGIPHNRASSSSSSLLARAPCFLGLPFAQTPCFLSSPFARVSCLLESLSASLRSPDSCLLANWLRSQAAFA